MFRRNQYVFLRLKYFSEINSNTDIEKNSSIQSQQLKYFLISDFLKSLEFKENSANDFKETIFVHFQFIIDSAKIYIQYHIFPGPFLKIIGS